MDATPVRTFSRGRRTSGPELATDPDAGWYVREGDHRDPDAPVSDAMLPVPPPTKKGKPKASQDKKKTSLKKKYLFGYDAHLIVTRDAEHDAVLLDDGTPISGSVDTNPATLPVTAQTTTPNPTSGSSPSEPWASSPSTTTARTSSGSRPERRARSSSKAAGTARPCPSP